MKNKWYKVLSAGLLSVSAMYLCTALVVTGCSGDNGSVTGGDAGENSEVVESSSDEEAEVSSSSEKKEKVEKPSNDKDPKDDGSDVPEKQESEKPEQAKSSSSEKKSEPAESSSSEEEISKPVEASSSSEESLNTEEAESSSSNEVDAYVDCSERPFPEDLMFLAGRGENDGPRFARCDNDTIIVHWLIHHTSDEYVVSTPETYVISLSEDDWGADSLEYFKHDYLDKADFDGFDVHNQTIEKDAFGTFMNFWLGYEYSDDEINCDATALNGAVRHHYRYSKEANGVSYYVWAYPLTEVAVDEKGTRTVRYGFTQHQVHSPVSWMPLSSSLT